MRVRDRKREKEEDEKEQKKFVLSRRGFNIPDRWFLKASSDVVLFIIIGYCRQENGSRLNSHHN